MKGENVNQLEVRGALFVTSESVRGTDRYIDLIDSSLLERFSPRYKLLRSLNVLQVNIM